MLPGDVPERVAPSRFDEVIQRDYGCGDPTPFVRPGDTVLDLESGGGKLGFIASQLAGESGGIIGVDCNPDMLELARRNRPIVAERLEYDNVEFRCGLIQDLQLDLEQFAAEAAALDMSGFVSQLELRDAQQRLRDTACMIPDESVDLVISNCVLNLVRPDDRRQLFREIHRVLKPGGTLHVTSDGCCSEGGGCC